MTTPIHDLLGLQNKNPRELAEFHTDAATLLIRCPRTSITADIRIELAVEHLEAADALRRAA